MVKKWNKDFDSRGRAENYCKYIARKYKGAVCVLQQVYENGKWITFRVAVQISPNAFWLKQPKNQTERHKLRHYAEGND